MITTTEALEDNLSCPTDSVVATLSKIEGDLMFLGVAGKMGPTMARMAVRASEIAGMKRRVIGVSRFSDDAAEAKLNSVGVETIKGDLLDRDFLASLPEVPNIVHMTGMKFGATGGESLTWAMNVHLPAMVCERFAQSRIAAFATGNVYGYVTPESSGSKETDALEPVGEYGMSAVGRERMFQYFSEHHGVPVSIIRLNYATELRYGLLVDLARQIHAGKPIDLGMGHANVIWQRDANAAALCTLKDCASPAFIVNVAGPEIFRVRDVCERMAALMDTEVIFDGTEANDALLNCGDEGRRRYGAPTVDLDTMLEWTANWVKNGGESLGKPTHFANRDGRF